MATATTLDPPARSAAPAGASARVRDPRLDFYRGLAMFIILCAHTPGNFFTSWIPARWGFSDATEIFVFCSGMASAIAFGGSYDRRGWTLGTARVGYRVWQVYWAHIGMFIFLAMLLAAIDLTGLFDKTYIGTLNLWKFFADPGPQLVGLFTLTYVPNYFDILPMYMVILMMMPMVMALARVNLWLLAAVLFTTWLLAQAPLWDSLGASGMILSLPAEPWSDRQWYFNPFGWQLVFFTGFAFMRGWIPAPPVKAWLIGLCLFIVIGNIAVSNIGVRELGFEWAREWRSNNSAWFAKSNFGLLRYVHFLALAYLSWVAAGVGGYRLLPITTDAISRVWTVSVAMIIKVGQQSLAIFIFSMVWARVVGFIMDQTGRNTAIVTFANLFGFALLIGVAYSVGWFKSQPWRKSATG